MAELARSDGAALLSETNVTGRGASTRLVAQLRRELKDASPALDALVVPGCQGCLSLKAAHESLLAYLVALSERAVWLESEEKAVRGKVAEALRKAYPLHVRRVEEEEPDRHIGAASVAMLCELVVRFAIEARKDDRLAGVAAGREDVARLEQDMKALRTELDQVRARLEVAGRVRKSSGAHLVPIPRETVDGFFDGTRTFFDVAREAALAAGGSVEWSLGAQVVRVQVVQPGARAVPAAPVAPAAPAAEAPAAPAARAAPVAPAAPAAAGRLPPAQQAPEAAPRRPPPAAVPPGAKRPGAAQQAPPRPSAAQPARPLAKPAGPAPAPATARGPMARPAPDEPARPQPAGRPAAPPAAPRAAEALPPPADETGAPEAPGAPPAPEAVRAMPLAADDPAAVATFVVDHGAWTRSVLKRVAAAAGADPGPIEVLLEAEQLVTPVPVEISLPDGTRAHDCLFVARKRLEEVLAEASDAGPIRATPWLFVGKQLSAAERPLVARALVPLLAAGWTMSSCQPEDTLFWMRLSRPAENPDGRYREGLLLVQTGDPPAQPGPPTILDDITEVCWIAGLEARDRLWQRLAKKVDVWEALPEHAHDEAAWHPIHRRREDSPRI